MKVKLRNKEISWLSFNARLLQEAHNPTVPLIERLKFLGIFSSNLDEFYRVRVATLKRLEKLGKKAHKIIGEAPSDILEKIHQIGLSLQADFEEAYQAILKSLEKERIFIKNEARLTPQQARFVKSYFHKKVRPLLIPIMVDQLKKFPELRDHANYLVVQMFPDQDAPSRHSLIEVPTQELSRFLILPEVGANRYIMLLDDVIRYCLEDIFAMFHFQRFEAYSITLIRDAELNIEDDFSESLIKKISKSLQQRKLATPVRFIYDHAMPGDLLKYVIKKLALKKTPGNIIPGPRYQNFKDFIGFPNIGPPSFLYDRPAPLPHKAIRPRESLLETLRKGDILLHYPYQTFDYVIDFLREAAIDPQVISIDIALYRVANRSKIINALINAARNGKKVSVAMELKARFDEEANIYWSNRLRDEGVRVIHSAPNLKVHSKLILIARKEKRKTVLYANIGTGNFNESTAKLYSDHALFTADARLTREVQKVFETLDESYTRPTFRHLLVSPFNMRERLIKLINNEIKQASKGQPARITAKLNNLTDPKIIKKLYEASQAGVVIRLMVRGMFSLIPGVKNMSENIRATGTIDKYLEHSRLFVFGNGGKEKFYLSSADWMPRNLDNRIEVACPIYDPEIQQEVRDFLEIHWGDNQKARILNKKLDNQFLPAEDREPLRAQEALYAYFQEKLAAPPDDGKFVSAKETEIAVDRRP